MSGRAHLQGEFSQARTNLRSRLVRQTRKRRTPAKLGKRASSSQSGSPCRAPRQHIENRYIKIKKHLVKEGIETYLLKITLTRWCYRRGAYERTHSFREGLFEIQYAFNTMHGAFLKVESLTHGGYHRHVSEQEKTLHLLGLVSKQSTYQRQP